MLLILTTVPDMLIAKSLARYLVEQKLAACVSFLPNMHSIYRWQDVIEEAEEILLLIKTSTARYAELEAAIQTMHPYEVPEIIALPSSAGLAAYFDWIEQTTQKDGDV